MVVDRVRHQLTCTCGQVMVQLLGSSVEAADDSLQLRKFLDELGREIGLGKARGFVEHAGTNCRSALANALSEPTADALNTPRLLVIRAEVFLEGYLLQPGDAFAQ